MVKLGFGEEGKIEKARQLFIDAEIYSIKLLSLLISHNYHFFASEFHAAKVQNMTSEVKKTEWS